MVDEHYSNGDKEIEMHFILGDDQRRNAVAVLPQHT